ncbi:hypothetical protein EDD21DRAFT_393033, partial [Dissophora ornata]
MWITFCVESFFFFHPLITAFFHHWFVLSMGDDGGKRRELGNIGLERWSEVGARVCTWSSLLLSLFSHSLHLTMRGVVV